MTGRLALGSGFPGARLPEEDFPQVVLQQELLVDTERLEQALDIARRKQTLFAAEGVIVNWPSKKPWPSVWLVPALPSAAVTPAVLYSPSMSKKELCVMSAKKLATLGVVVACMPGRYDPVPYSTWTMWTLEIMGPPK